MIALIRASAVLCWTRSGDLGLSIQTNTEFYAHLHFPRPIYTIISDNKHVKKTQKNCGHEHTILIYRTTCAMVQKKQYIFEDQPWISLDQMYLGNHVD
jgi:hypothetical protein